MTEPLKPMHLRPRSRLLTALIVVLALIGQPAAVLGDHGGRDIRSFLRCDRPVAPPRCTSVGDNLRHVVVFDATLTDGLADALRDTLAEDYGPTKLTTVVDETITDRTDVVAYSEDYGDNGAAGWVYCPADAPQGVNAQGDRWCRQQQLHFNLNPRYAVFFADEASRDHVACHEIGHTVGLLHWGNPPESAEPTAATCMNSNTPNGPTGLHQIDRDHVNAYAYSVPRAPHPWIRLIAEKPAIRATASAWATATVDALEVEHFATPEQLVAAADAVVRGRIASIGPGRSFGGATGVAFHYAAATVVVDDVLAGALPDGHRTMLTLEIPLFGGQATLSRLQQLEAVDSVFLLRNKGESARAAGMGADDVASESDYYRLVTQDAVVEERGGRATLPAGGDGALAGFDGLPFDLVISRLRAAD